MAAGMFIFGLGVSPLAVVQETIIVRFFKSHGLGVSMAFGLVVGKVHPSSPPAPLIPSPNASVLARRSTLPF
ncbi:hypothetical protein B0H16DRAFT_28038 [Mycena metata]|uniref:Uncharacterized protein n=1 Tax=Mycena metata TaxID=1033252 RepID=A0AAD7P383_9AGAR|nr:hypothetical protein B0H16DRAFT_28038 [Mycena metata]